VTRTLFRVLLILLLGGALVAALLRIQKNARALQTENRKLSLETAALAEKETAATRSRDALQAELAAVGAQLSDATNAAARVAATQDGTAVQQHDKLRAEIARLSEESVRLETQLAALRSQYQELQGAKSQADAALRALQAGALSASNEIVRLRGMDADKTARLATRDQELANLRTELGTAKKAAQELTTAKAAAELALQALQAKSGADQAELAALRGQLAELKAKSPDTPAPKPAP
jgi:chromosome segregation ATPase